MPVFFLEVGHRQAGRCPIADKTPSVAYLLPKMDRIAKNIKLAREYKNLTQEYMAKSIGVSQATYCRIETGRTDIRVSMLRAIAAGLKVPFSKLVTEDLAELVTLLQGQARLAAQEAELAAKAAAEAALAASTAAAIKKAAEAKGKKTQAKAPKAPAKASKKAVRAAA